MASVPLSKDCVATDDGKNFGSNNNNDLKEDDKDKIVEYENENIDDNDDGDDSEENDEDYDPAQDVYKNGGDDEDEDMDVDDANDDNLNENNCSLPKSQLKAVDQAFEELFGYPWGTKFRRKKAKEAVSKRERILLCMFGPTGASQILSSLGYGSNRDNNNHIVEKRQPQQRMRRRSTTAAGKAVASVAKMLSTENYERKSQDGAAFLLPAGRTKKAIPLPAFVSPSFEEASGFPKNNNNTPSFLKPPPPPKDRRIGSNLDKVLQELAGPTKVTTITKTSTDWDHFKIKSGLEEELEAKAQSKDSYLNRQDFLTRIDHRTFELEKKDRDLERAKRGK